MKTPQNKPVQLENTKIYTDIGYSMTSDHDRNVRIEQLDINRQPVGILDVNFGVRSFEMKFQHFDKQGHSTYGLQLGEGFDNLVIETQCYQKKGKTFKQTINEKIRFNLGGSFYRNRDLYASGGERMNFMHFKTKKWREEDYDRIKAKDFMRNATLKLNSSSNEVFQASGFDITQFDFSAIKGLYIHRESEIIDNCQMVPQPLGTFLNALPELTTAQKITQSVFAAVKDCAGTGGFALKKKQAGPMALAC